MLAGTPPPDLPQANAYSLLRIYGELDSAKVEIKDLLAAEAKIRGARLNDTRSIRREVAKMAKPVLLFESRLAAVEDLLRDSGYSLKPKPGSVAWALRQQAEVEAMIEQEDREWRKAHPGMEPEDEQP